MVTFTLEEIVLMLVAIAAGILLIIGLNLFKLDVSFFYAGCEGEIEGIRCSGVLSEEKHPNINAITNITITNCGEDIKTAEAIDNSLCSNLVNYSQCVFARYTLIKREDENISVCLWDEKGYKTTGGKKTYCFMNAELSCEDFSQKTVPKCQDVPGCRQVSVVKKVIEDIKSRVIS
jgi:hypothetical protein